MAQLCTDSQQAAANANAQCHLTPLHRVWGVEKWEVREGAASLTAGAAA